MLKRFGLLVALCLASVWAEEPLFRVGIMSDTHVKKDIATCDLIKKAFVLFKAHQVEMIVNLGDVADYHYPKAYDNYYATYRQIYPENEPSPKTIFIYANHDKLVPENDPDFVGFPTDEESYRRIYNKNIFPKGMQACFEDMKQRLHIENEPWDAFEFKGYQFVILPQWWGDLKVADATIASAVAKSGSKPVFVLDHVPPYDANFQRGGDTDKTAIFVKYPTVINFTGHTHGTMENEKRIWQSRFTHVNVGDLYDWGGHQVGGAPVTKHSDGVIVMEVYPDKLQLRRFYLTTGKEMKPNQLWSIPLPFDAKTAPYRYDVRLKNSPVLEFASDAQKRMKLTAHGKPMVEWRLSFPIAQGEDRVHNYKIELFRKEADGSWKKFARKDLLGDYWEQPEKRTGTAKQAFDAGFFEAGKMYRFVVTPFNYFGKAGKSISCEGVAPETRSSQVVYESKKPMEECSFLTGLVNGEPPKRDGEYYLLADRNNRLCFPEEIWQKIPTNQTCRFIIEMQTIVPSSWSLVLRDKATNKNMGWRIYTPSEDSGLQRYVIIFRKRTDKSTFDFWIREGKPGKIRFESLKVEMLTK